MSEQDRGAYTPQSDAPLAFDPRQSRGGGGPAPMTLLVSAIILLALIVGLLLFYRHGMRHPGQAPQLVGAPVGQTKAPPPAEAAGGDQAAGLQVYKSEATPPSEGRAPSFEQPPEQPAPLPAPRPPVAPPAVITSAPLRGAAGVPSAPPAAAPRPVVVAKAAPKPQPPVATQPVDTENVAGSAFASHAAPRPAPAAATPKVAPKPVSRTTEVASAAPSKPASAAKPKAKPAAPADELASTSASGGGTMVQIGAFSSSALAQKGWSDTAHLLPGPMAGKTRKVEMTSKDGKTFYRAYVGGFASHAAAESFCSALRAKGKACFVK
ncbi:MAG: SPOR domain-containing protein [Caulobacteraceae bacterium]|nr:SPOR domain-containing protein [Caulobacteraceae bacterium]